LTQNQLIELFESDQVKALVYRSEERGFVEPAEFERYKSYGEEELDFAWVESGPLVRSSYHAHEQTTDARAAANTPAASV